MAAVVGDHGGRQFSFRVPKAMPPAGFVGFKLALMYIARSARDSLASVL